MTDYKGVAVSPGRVIDPVKVMAPPVAEPPLNDSLPEGEPRETEAARIAESAAAVKADLEKRAEAAHGDGKAVLEATAQMAADPTLTTSAEQLVRTAGMSAERAVWEAGDQVATMLEGLGGYMAERVADVKDVRARIVAHLRGEQAPGIPFSTERFVLAAIDLAPADTATLRRWPAVAHRDPRAPAWDSCRCRRERRREHRAGNGRVRGWRRRHRDQ